MVSSDTETYGAETYGDNNQKIIRFLGSIPTPKHITPEYLDFTALEIRMLAEMGISSKDLTFVTIYGGIPKVNWNEAQRTFKSIDIKRFRMEIDLRVMLQKQDDVFEYTVELPVYDINTRERITVKIGTHVVLPVRKEELVERVYNTIQNLLMHELRECFFFEGKQFFVQHLE